jgi:hypothetical protein
MQRAKNFWVTLCFTPYVAPRLSCQDAKLKISKLPHLLYSLFAETWKIKVMLPKYFFSTNHWSQRLPVSIIDKMVAEILDTSSLTEVVARFVQTVDRTIELSTSSSEPVRVAFDCEGVNLCRVGSVELVAVAFDIASSSEEDIKGALFLVDLGSRGRQAECLAALQRLFECPSVVKVIHDCCMDCDALYHLHGGITLENVHDTSCFHAVITGQEDKNLNDVLTYNGVDENVIRDKDV